MTSATLITIAVAATVACLAGVALGLRLGFRFGRRGARGPSCALKDARASGIPVACTVSTQVVEDTRAPIIDQLNKVRKDSETWKTPVPIKIVWTPHRKGGDAFKPWRVQCPKTGVVCEFETLTVAISYWSVRATSISLYGEMIVVDCEPLPRRSDGGAGS